MSKAEILERERARALPTALATLLGIALLIAGPALGDATLLAGQTASQVLPDFQDDRGPILFTALCQAVGMALLALPLFYLFQAASARSEQMRHQLIGVTVAGPIFFAASFILQWFAYDAASKDFEVPGAGAGIPVGEFAEDLLRDQIALDASLGLQFAGLLGLVVAIVYTSLHAQRVGLLTRFWGTLGMALGVSLLFLGLIGILVYFVVLALIIAGWFPGGRPPAWAAGEAVPWPSPRRDAPDEDEDEDPDRPADPDEFAGTIEGSATEVDADDDSADGSSAPRKRKRRS